MKNLQMIVEANQPSESSELLRMNVAIAELGREYGHSIFIGEKYCFTNESQNEAELVQSIEVSETLNELLNEIGATLEPSLEQLDAHFYGNKNMEDIPVRIRSKEAVYQGSVGIGIMSKTLSLWTDATEWKEVSSSDN